MNTPTPQSEGLGDLDRNEIIPHDYFENILSKLVEINISKVKPLIPHLVPTPKPQQPYFTDRTQGLKNKGDDIRPLGEPPVLFNFLKELTAASQNNPLPPSKIDRSFILSRSLPTGDVSGDQAFERLLAEFRRRELVQSLFSILEENFGQSEKKRNAPMQ